MHQSVYILVFLSAQAKMFRRFQEDTRGNTLPTVEEHEALIDVYDVFN